MRLDTFSYELPPDLIAQRPAEDPEDARLLRVGEPNDPIKRVGDLAELLPVGALVVVNDTRVLPARLHGRKQKTHGRVELLLAQRTGSLPVDLGNGLTVVAETWRAMGRASKGFATGTEVLVEAAATTLVARVLGRGDDGLLNVALWSLSGAPVADTLRAVGHVPLPPYIRRPDTPQDATRYQTVFAKFDGAIAAPTAGLHFTPALVQRLQARGCHLVSVTLHVGLGTFQPVAAEDLDDHPMHEESFVVSQAATDAIADARIRGAPVVAIGTTVVRALESAARGTGVEPTDSTTRLLIQPGYRFRVVDLLLTNFHLPRSTLLALVCAFGGTAPILDAYRVAFAHRFRFYSYGDAMLIARHP